MKCLAHGHGLLRLVRAVVAVLDADPVPVHCGVEVALVDDVDDDLGALAHLERRARDGAVVGEHPNRFDLPSSLVTGAIRSSNSSPSESSTSSGATTSTTPAVSVGKFSVRMDKLSFPDEIGSIIREGGNFVGDELGVVFDPPEQRGSPRVLPGETEEIEARARR